MMNGLNTPLKRIGFIVLVAGLIILAIGLYQIVGSSYRTSDALTKWVESFFFEKYSFRRYPLASYGTWIVIIGLLLSFLYEKITLRLVDWIKGNNRNDSVQPQKIPELYFKDAKSALEYSCEYLNTDLAENELTACLVIATSQSKESGAFAVINVPSSSGPKKYTAAFLNETIPTDIAGRLCAALVGPIKEHGGDPTFMLCAELEPTWSNGAWKVKRRF